MTLSRVWAAALLSVAVCGAESAVAGKWSCINVSDAGPQSSWTLVVREDDARLTGVLTDGQVELPLLELKLEAARFAFGFDINGKPYRFAGTVEGGKFEGRYRGEEASGKLQCAKR